MLDRLITDIKTAPDAIRARRSTLRHRVHVLRGEGQERIWTLETNTLSRAEDLLERAEALPVVSRVTTPVERALHRRLEDLTAPPIPDYDTLNAKKAARAVRGLDRVDLAKVRYREQATKNRKTVLDAVSRELDKLREEPVPADQ